jgi:hypothetical protein
VLKSWIASSAWFAAGSIPIITLIVALRWLGPLRASSWLVAYGVLVLLFEHAGFTFVWWRTRISSATIHFAIDKTASASMWLGSTSAPACPTPRLFLMLALVLK